MDDLLATGRMKLSPAGAHLTSTGTEHGELFYLSSTTKHGEGNAIRGGVPVIAPWFADILGRSPKHGWARISPWRVTVDSIGFDASLVEGGIALALNVKELPDGVRLELTATNESGEPRTVQLAFHPYFRVGHVEKVTVQGLDGVAGLDRVTDAELVQKGDVKVAGLYDRIFLESREAVIEDPGLGRRITVAAEGADSTVVWNPGEEAAAPMSDIGDGEWSDFLCVEPALLGEGQQGIELADGASHRLSMTVTVQGR